MTKRYPYPFAVGDQFKFENKHGSCMLEAVKTPQPVNTIRLEDAPQECLMSLDKLEQIALITDQVRLQPLFGSRYAFILHDTTNSAAFVKVVSLVYRNPNKAKDQIEADMNAGRNRWHP